ncbi:hypothetical protein QVD17_16588 [Tagetes erecta]|uniref:Uncharacterized protein n=1 Tax=Tagetes erecta TaxID=13708 RepID=A0AAD8KVG4_TARER|nr:hypothetical protein QVD17_16588 [Tagetes erecta]
MLIGQHHYQGAKCKCVNKNPNPKPTSRRRCCGLHPKRNETHTSHISNLLQLRLAHRFTIIVTVASGPPTCHLCSFSIIHSPLIVTLVLS